MKEKKFYNKLWFAWVCLFIFPLQPLGIYLFIKNKHYGKALRYGLCVLFGLVFLQVAADSVQYTPQTEQIESMDDSAQSEALVEDNQQAGQQSEVAEQGSDAAQENLVDSKQEEEMPLENQSSPEATQKPTNQVASERPQNQSTEAQVHFIDTGNSDAILITSGNQAMLIDGGENDDETFLVNYLKAQGITTLDYVIATHAHADHVGALDAVISNLTVNKVFIANGDADTKTYRDFINAAINKGLSPSVPLEDKQFPLGSGYFTIMNTNGGSDTNNESLVVEYVNGEDKMLFMGDAETEVENEILSKLSQVDVLKVGHHGSKTSSSVNFLNKVKPQYAVITCGADNSYGHPHQETMTKLEGMEIHRTDECGSIVFKSTGKGIVTSCSSASLTPGKKQTASGTSTTPSTPKPSAGTNTTPSNNTSKTVYWTPNGKSYHTTSGCSTLSRSKVIHSGTISESGKYDPCDRCH